MMERLSERLIGILNEQDFCFDLHEMNDVQRALIRLAAYEDTGLTPEEITSMASYIDQYGDVSVPSQYEQAEDEGRLIVLPCKVGSAVYTINEQYFDCENCQYKEEAHYQPHIDKVACDKEDRHCPLAINERIVEGFEISKSKTGEAHVGDPGEWGYEGLETFYGFDGRVYFTREEAEVALEETK